MINLNLRASDVLSVSFVSLTFRCGHKVREGAVVVLVTLAGAHVLLL